MNILVKIAIIIFIIVFSLGLIIALLQRSFKVKTLVEGLSLNSTYLVSGNVCLGNAWHRVLSYLFHKRTVLNASFATYISLFSVVPKQSLSNEDFKTFILTIIVKVAQQRPLEEIFSFIENHGFYMTLTSLQQLIICYRNDFALPIDIINNLNRYLEVVVQPALIQFHIGSWIGKQIYSGFSNLSTFLDQNPSVYIFIAVVAAGVALIIYNKTESDTGCVDNVELENQPNNVLHSIFEDIVFTPFNLIISFQVMLFIIIIFLYYFRKWRNIIPEK